MKDQQFINFIEESGAFDNDALSLTAKITIQDMISWNDIELCLLEASTKSVKNVFLSAFKNGKVYEDFDKDLFSKSIKEVGVQDVLNNLPCSLRLTNLQLLNKEIQLLCHKLYSNIGEAISVNLYVTPGEGRDCFDFHLDPQESYIYQVTGEKNWLMPISKDGKAFIAKNEADLKGIESMEMVNVKFQKRDLRYIPFCVPHKAIANTSGLSIHLTFAVLKYFKSSFLYFLESKFKVKNFVNYYELVSRDNVKKWLVELDLELDEDQTEKLYREFKTRQTSEELLIMKNGRPYSSSKVLWD